MDAWKEELRKIESGEVVAKAPKARIKQLEGEIKRLRQEHAAEMENQRLNFNALAMQIAVLTELCHALQAGVATGASDVLPIRGQS